VRENDFTEAQFAAAPRTIAAVRAGFDKLVLSLHPADPGAFLRQLTAQPQALTGYRPATGPFAAEGAYALLYQYGSTSPTRPDVDLLLAPRTRGLPVAQLALRASIEQLITRRSVARAVVDQFGCRFSGTSVVSVAELAIDFPREESTHTTICSEAYGPWTRCTQWYETTFYLTTASGLFCVRIYEKIENGITVVRAELILRRRFFRRHSVQGIADLVSTAWLEAARRSLRFMRYDPTTRRAAADNGEIEQLIAAVGVNEALRRYAGDAQRIRRRLAPTGHDDQARVALARLRRELLQ